MRVYADSSFILRLVVAEPETEQAVAEYRRLDRPSLFYLPLHALEVETAIRQRAFHEKRVAPSGQRTHIRRERDAALARLKKFVQRGALAEVALDMDAAVDLARQISSRHTDRLGARAVDVLHAAAALLLKSELFLTFDERQLALAKAEQLNTAGL